MKRILLITLSFCLLLGSVDLFADEKSSPVNDIKEKDKKIKRGWNFGPLPAVGYNSDLGLQYGALCDMYYYGDGSTFPVYLHKFNVEISRYTKGTGVYHLFYDSKFLIPNVRLTFATTYMPNKMYRFHGFNGLSSPFDADFNNDNPAYHAIDRKMFRMLADFQGQITDKIGWAAGLAFWSFRTGPVTLSQYEDADNLWKYYIRGMNPIIPRHQQNGGDQLELKAGLVYDTRDLESAPSRGIWAELVAYGSPDIFERNGDEYLKLSAHFRHYVTVAPNRLVFAYHLAYQGTIAGSQPFYMLQNISRLYLRQINSEGLGGTNTVRGAVYNRLVGEGYFWSNAEFRVRLFDFKFLNQYWYLAVNPFFDMGMVVQPYRLKAMKESIYSDIVYSGEKERMHFSAGAGLKIAMNQNFIISVEWAKPFDKRIGKNGMSISLNYIF